MPFLTLPNVASDPQVPSGPLLGGVEFRRPSSRSVTWEPVRSSVTLGNGSTRSYDSGRRMVVALAWGRLSKAQADSVGAALAVPYVPYQEHVDADPVTMSTDEGVQVEAIPGTAPVLYSVSTTLRSQATFR